MKALLPTLLLVLFSHAGQACELSKEESEYIRNFNKEMLTRWPDDIPKGATYNTNEHVFACVKTNENIQFAKSCFTRTNGSGSMCWVYIKEANEPKYGMRLADGGIGTAQQEIESFLSECKGGTCYFGMRE